MAPGAARLVLTAGATARHARAVPGPAGAGPSGTPAKGRRRGRTYVLLWVGPGEAHHLVIAADPPTPEPAMTNRIAKTLLATAAVAALALPAGAQAKNGADDPAGHVRHAAHQTTTAGAQSQSRTRHRHRHGRRHVRRADDNSIAAQRRSRGADDALGHVRGGADDGLNHS
jgi:hypothetical protein